MIAAIEGHACAGGLGVALFCDIRIVDETATFGVFSRRWGVPMSDGTTVRLPRIVGQGRALDMLLTGRAVGADEAIAIGLATRKVARGTTRAEAEKLAAEIAGFPPIAMTSDRQSAYESFDRDQEAAMRREMELSLAARRQESQKGAARFAQGEGRHGKFERVMMRALVCEAYGPVELAQGRGLAGPSPRPGEILVRVGAAGVSFAAMLGMQGKHQNKPALPYVPGNEMAGHVVKLGPGVTNLDGRPARHDRRQPGRLCRICRGHRRQRHADPRDHALRPGDQLPDALSDRLRRAQMEGRHAARRGAAGARRGRRLGPDRHRGRQGDGRRRDRLGGRRRQARPPAKPAPIT